MTSIFSRPVSSTASLLLACAAPLACGDDGVAGDASATAGDTAADETTGTSPDDDGDDTIGAPDTGGTDTGGSDTGGSTASVDDTGTSTGDAPPGDCEPPTALPGPLASGSWDERFTLAGLTGRDGFAPIVRDVTLDTDGSVLVAGYFRWADGDPLEGLARWDAGQWTLPRDTWDGVPMPGEGFSAVTVDAEGTLAAATTDLTLAGNGEFWLDVGDGPDVIGQYTGLVRRLAWVGDELWAVGNFQIAAGPAGLARWDGTEWLPAPDGPPNGPVYDLLADGAGGLYLGGAFTQIGGIPTNAVAHWDGAAWTPMSMPVEGRVYALELDDTSTLFAGGSFFYDDSPEYGSLARWTGGAWEIESGGVAQGPAFGVVSDLMYQDGSMLVAGCFDAVGGGGNPVPSRGLASMTDGTWTSLDAGEAFGSAWFDSLACGFEPDPNAVFSMQHQRLLDDGTGTWLVGSFGGKGDAVSRGVVRYEAGAWETVGTAGLGLSGTIAQLQLDPSTCEVVGLTYGTHAGAEPLVGGLARFDATQGWTADSPPLPDGDCTDLVVRASGEAVLGCTVFDDVGVTGNLLRMGDDAWESFAEVPGGVQDLELAPDDSVWVAGGGETGWVAQLVRDRLTVVEDGFDLPVLLVAVAPTGEGYDVIAGGPFTSVAGQAAARIARFDGSQWQPLGDGLVSTPSAIEATEELVYAASWDEGLPERMVLGVFEDGTWTELGDPAHGLADPSGLSSHTFTSLVAVEGGLVAVGYVWPEDGGRNAFFFDGRQIGAIGGGIAAISVDDVVLTEDALLFGGTIAEVGPNADLHPSVGMARFVWSE